MREGVLGAKCIMEIGESYAATVQKPPRPHNERSVFGPIPKEFWDSVSFSWGELLAIVAVFARFNLRRLSWSPGMDRGLNGYERTSLSSATYTTSAERTVH